MGAQINQHSGADGRADHRHQLLEATPVLMNSRDDTELVRRCLAGHVAAFEPLVAKYHKVLFGVALRLVNDYEDARDLTQSAFMKAFEKLNTYDPNHKFFSWIYRILVNESLNLLKRRKPQETLDAARVLSLGSLDGTPADDYERRRLADVVQAAIMQLNPEARQVLVLRHFADLSYEEIASTLEIPQKTVKSRLFAARRQLCAILLHRTAAR